jgi:hypothetical protein
MAGTQLFGLDYKFYRTRWEQSFYGLTTVPHYQDLAFNSRLPHRCRYMHNHRLTSNLMHHFGQLGMHAHSFAGGQYYR